MTGPAERQAEPLPRAPRTVRAQLLLSVNTLLAAVVLLFLAVDYRVELAERIAEKHISLVEEAATLAAAVDRLRAHGLEAVQEYIDAVCGRMRESYSPGHHIAVVIGRQVLQAVVHHRASAEMVRAMQEAAASGNHRARIGDQELVVGHTTQGDVTVYISEYLTNVRRRLHAEYWSRLLAIVAVGLLAAAVVDWMLVRIVVRPTQELAATIRRIGAGELGIQTPRFGTAEYAYLGEAINEMSRALAEHEARRRRELARARAIQQHLLPADLNVAGLRVSVVFKPAEEVGGDYYDVLPLPNGEWLLCVADVTGHGIPAAMIAAILKSLVTHGVEHQADPSHLLGFVNRQLCALHLPDHLATMALAAWRPAERRIVYASAGHEPLLLLHDRTVQPLPATGILLGAVPEMTYVSRCVPFAPGDRLLLPTDGAAEAMNASGELFGRQKLRETFLATADDPPEVAVHRIAGAIARHRRGHPLSDDLTLLLIEAHASSPQHPRQHA